MKPTWRKNFDNEVCSLIIGMYILKITNRPFTAYKHTGRVYTLSHHGEGDVLQPHWTTAGNNLRKVKKELLDKLKELVGKDVEALKEIL